MSNNTLDDKPLPLVSAVITTHNRKELLMKALQSVLNQSYSNLEIIVVDDASDDGTRECMEDYLRQNAGSLRFPVDYIYNAEGGGGNHARNTGILKSSGKYVAFLDDDDEWMPEKIEKQVLVLEENPQSAVVSCGRIIDYNGEKRKQEDFGYFTEGDLRQLVYSFIPFTTSCVIINRALILDVGLFDEDLRYWQEYELALRLCQKTEVRILKEYLVLYRVSVKDRHRLTNHVNGWEKAVEYIEKKHEKTIASLPDEIKLAHRILILSDGAQRCENCGDKKREREYLKKIRQLKPTAANWVKYILNRSRLR